MEFKRVKQNIIVLSTIAGNKRRGMDGPEAKTWSPSTNLWTNTDIVFETKKCQVDSSPIAPTGAIRGARRFPGLTCFS